MTKGKRGQLKREGEGGGEAEGEGGGLGCPVVKGGGVRRGALDAIPSLTMDCEHVYSFYVCHDSFLCCARTRSYVSCLLGMCIRQHTHTPIQL